MSIVTFTLTGIKRFQARATRRANFMGTPAFRKLLREEGKEMVQDIQEFVGKQNPGQLKDLHPDYKKTKKKNVGNVYPIMWATGYLLSHMKASVRKGKKRGGWIVGVVFSGGVHPGANIPTRKLAMIHLRGQGVPKRDFLILPKNHRRKFHSRVRKALKAIK